MLTLEDGDLHQLIVCQISALDAPRVKSWSIPPLSVQCLKIILPKLFQINRHHKHLGFYFLNNRIQLVSRIQEEMVPQDRLKFTYGRALFRVTLNANNITI